MLIIRDVTKNYNICGLPLSPCSTQLHHSTYIIYGAAKGHDGYIDNRVTNTIAANDNL